LTSINREGTWLGFDLDTIKNIEKNVNVLLIAHGGCGLEEDINILFKLDICSIALGSIVVFQKKGMGVLVNFPDKALIKTILSNMAN
jgi:imidazole glycerol-phosphate synthase subunit HisF